MIYICAFDYFDCLAVYCICRDYYSNADACGICLVLYRQTVRIV